MREYLCGVAGNGELRQRLGNDIEKGLFSHAYILAGQKGIGKERLATEITAALACEHRTDARYPLPCGSCTACKKILGGVSPDVIHVTREEDKATMGIDVIRRLREDVSTVPNDLPFKVYLIHDAHTMTQQAQNAFLLTLEEPPAFVRFLLLCDEPALLLETIRSRAPVYRMQPVKSAEAEAFLLSPAREPKISRAAAQLKENAPDEFAALLRASGGAIGRAVELLDPDQRAPLMERRAAVLRLCELLSQRTKKDEILTALLSFGKSRDEAVTRLLLLQEALRDLLAAFYSDTPPLVFFTDTNAALELAATFTARRLLSISDAVSKTLSSLAANGNVRLLLFELFGKL